MKLLFVTPGLTYGGAERVISHLANEWNKNDNIVKIVITGENDKPAYPLSDSVEVVGLGGLKNRKFRHISLISSIRKEIKLFHPDVVICFMNDTCAFTIFSMIGMKIPLIYSERNDPNRVNQGKKDKIYRRLVEKIACGFVFQTTAAMECYPKDVQKKSTIILNPMDVSNIPECNYLCDGKYFVSIARLEPQKNHKLLIEAFLNVVKIHPEYKLKLYGTGSLERELKDLVAFLQLNEKVQFMGNSSSVLEEIKDSSAFVLSSDFEGLPNVLIEAMAMGLPCISTDCSPGGARELIDNNINGIIVPCNNVKMLSEAMLSVVSDRQNSIIIGKNAKNIRQRVIVDDIATQWINFIRGRL